MLEKLRKGEGASQEELEKVQVLATELDMKYLNLQSVAEKGPQGFDMPPSSDSIKEYMLIWQKAVAASALCFAAGSNAYESAIESTYDAAIIAEADDRRRFLDRIEAILANRQQ